MNNHNFWFVTTIRSMALYISTFYWCFRFHQSLIFIWLDTRTHSYICIMNHLVAHNRDRPEICENPLIEHTITGFMGLLKSGHKSYKLINKAAQILFNNNNVQPSNIKLMGNRRHDFWHMALTVHFSILIFILLLFSCFNQLVQI